MSKYPIDIGIHICENQATVKIAIRKEWGEKANRKRKNLDWWIGSKERKNCYLMPPEREGERLNTRIILTVDSRSVDVDDYTTNDDGSISIDLLTTRGVAMESGRTELWVRQQRQWGWLRPLFTRPVNSGYLYSIQAVKAMEQELNLDRKETSVEYK